MASPEMVYAAKKHIEAIRRTRFSIGEAVPSTETILLLSAADHFAREIGNYGFNFVWELIQNAEDNKYPSGVKPYLEFLVIQKDITHTGAPQTLVVTSNEVGFSKQDMDAICSIGVSTKRGRRNEGFIGERGFGFKSVFQVSNQPHIISNGYQIRFTSVLPNIECPILMAPEWNDSEITIADIKGVCGSQDRLPNTIIILPLRTGYYEFVRNEFARTHNEHLLFLSKLERITMQIDDGYSWPQTPAFFKKLDRKTDEPHTCSIHSDLYMAKLSVLHTCDSHSCDYYIYRQKFPVTTEKKIDGREDVENMLVSIAFPLGERLSEEFPCNVFSYFPTMIMGMFRFLIHSDFVLTPSMEINFDSKWNKWVFDCVPTAFVNAILAFVNTGNKRETLVGLFLRKHLPFEAYSISNHKDAKVMNSIIKSIERKLKALPIVPCHTIPGGDVRYEKPRDVRRIFPAFRKLLHSLKNANVHLDGMQPGEKSLFFEPLDNERDGKVFQYHGVGAPDSDPDWYGKFIQDCRIVPQLSEELYLTFLCFIASNWNIFGKCNVAEIPLVKYIAEDGIVKLCSINALRKGKLRVCFSMNTQEHGWLIKCNQKFGFPSNLYLLPIEIQEGITTHKSRYFLCAWLLLHVMVSNVTVQEYGNFIIEYLAEKNSNLNAAILLPHFLHKSMENKFLWESQVFELCHKMPIVDGSGTLHAERTATLVPENGSKWMKLFGWNPFAENKYIALGGNAYDKFSERANFMNFLCKYTKAVDLPEISPPNVRLPITCCQLSAEQAFLLLDWIKFLREKATKLPELFIQSIRNGKWMKNTINGFSSPTQCVLFGPQGNSCGSSGDLLFPIDEHFYENRINMYKDELKLIGVNMICSKETW